SGQLAAMVVGVTVQASGVRWPEDHLRAAPAGRPGRRGFLGVTAAALGASVLSLQRVLAAPVLLHRVGGRREPRESMTLLAVHRDAGQGGGAVVRILVAPGAGGKGGSLEGGRRKVAVAVGALHPGVTAPERVLGLV